MYFRNYGLPKTSLDKCLKSPSFRTTFDSQHARAPKTTEICREPSLAQFFTTIRERELENVSFSHISNLRIVC